MKTSSFWDERYSATEYAYGTEPNEYLRSLSSLFSSATKVLVPADGEGRNGVFIASLGADVLSVDASEAGISKAQALANDRRVPLQTLHTDLLTWEWPVGTFDRVVSIFFHASPGERETLHRRMMASLKPGGILLLEAFNKSQIGLPSGGPKDVNMLFDPDILRSDFAGQVMEELSEKSVFLREGPFHQGSAQVIQALVRKVV